MYINPPRPGLAMPMTESERAIMVQHVAYRTEKLKEGIAYTFGPVTDPAGKINRHEYFPVKAVVPQISIG